MADEDASEQHLSFFVEWYDPQSDQKKPYVLHYYNDQTLELIERTTKRTFLKRIRIPTIQPQHLFLGASLTIYSRQLSVLDAANAYTKRKLQHTTNHKSFLIRPSGYAHIGRILSALEQQHARILHIAMTKLEPNQLQPLGLPSSDQSLLHDVSILVELQPSDTLNLDSIGFTSFMIPLPNEIDWKQSFPPTCVLDNCTLCIIKPRAIQDGHVGSILDMFLKHNIEVSAINSLHLRMTDADEFFQVYKGIFRQYQEVLKAMCASPCIALELRGDDIVRQVRELVGPWDVQIAKTLRPSSLRAQFGTSNLHNAVHCTDCPEDGVLECQFFFSLV